MLLVSQGNAILNNIVRFLETFLNVPPFKQGGRQAVRSPRAYLRRTLFHGLFHVKYGRQLLIVHFNQLNGFLRGLFINSGYDRNLITHVADLFRYHGTPEIETVIVPWRATGLFLPGNIVLVGKYRTDPRQRLRGRGIYMHNLCMGIWAA